VYTVESLARAYALLSDDGVLVLSFGTGEGTFLASKLARMLTAATGKPPLVYHDANRRIFITPRGAHREPPPEFGPFRLLPLVPDDVAVATDAEYLGMAVGHDALLLLVIVAYVSSWMCRRLAWQPG
jgi:hypothetical protein